MSIGDIVQNLQQIQALEVEEMWVLRFMANQAATTSDDMSTKSLSLVTSQFGNQGIIGSKEKSRIIRTLKMKFKVFLK